MNKIFLGIIVIALLVTGCTKDQIDINGGKRGNRDGSIAFYPTTKSIKTKGTPRDDFGAYGSVNLIVYNGDVEDGNVYATRELRQPSLYNNGTEHVQYDCVPPLMWPDGEQLSFVAYASDIPYAAAGITFHNASLPTAITYTIPTDVKSQPDLLVAAVAAQTKPSDAIVDLEMQHALACVSFCATSTTFNYIKSIRITGVAASGVYTLGTALDENAWDITGASRTIQFTAGMNDSEIQSSYTNLGYLMNTDGFLMMVPQDLSGSRAQIEVVYLNDDKTEETLIYLIPEGTVWLPGKKYVYIMDEGAPIAAVTYWEEYADGSLGLYYVNGYEIVDNIPYGKTSLDIVNAGYGLLVPAIYQSYYDNAQSIQMSVGSNDYETANIYSYGDDNIVATGVKFGATNRPLNCVLFTLSQNNYPFGHTDDDGATKKGICPYATNTPESTSATIYNAIGGSDIAITTYGKCLPHYARGVYTSRNTLPSAHYIRTPMQMRNISYQTQPADFSTENFTTNNIYVQEFAVMDYKSRDLVRGNDVKGKDFYETIVQGLFNGTFDGRDTYNQSGIGKRETGATIDKLEITTLTATPGLSYSGHYSVALFAVNTGRISYLTSTKDCAIINNIAKSAISIATFAGFNAGTIDHVTNRATLSNNSIGGVANGDWLPSLTGGIAGWNGVKGGTVSNCKNFGKIEGSMYMGGVVAYNNYNGIVKKCDNGDDSNIGDVDPLVCSIYDLSADNNESKTAPCVGGVVGIQQCGDGPLAANTYLPIISNCINYATIGGNVSGYAANVGGIVGENDWNWSGAGNLIPATVLGQVSLCVNYGNVINHNGIAENGAGGIAGVNNGKIDHCQATGSITAGGSVSVGGIAGYSIGEVTDCLYYHASPVCQIKANSGGYAGGITGYLESSKEWYAESGLIDRCLFLAVAPTYIGGNGGIPPAPATGFMSNEYLYRFPTGTHSFYVNLTPDGRVLDRPLYTVNNVYMLTGDDYNYNTGISFYEPDFQDTYYYGPFSEGRYPIGILRLSTDHFSTIPFREWYDKYGWQEATLGSCPYVVPGEAPKSNDVPKAYGSAGGFQSSFYNMVDKIRTSVGTAYTVFNPTTNVVNSLRFDFSNINPQYIANVTSIEITCTATFDRMFGGGTGSATFMAPKGWTIKGTKGINVWGDSTHGWYRYISAGTVEADKKIVMVPGLTPTL